jgi:phosphatidylethanolamine/phosphatidyl-N-methylethanolamine N-methyltransferase
LPLQTTTRAARGRSDNVSDIFRFLRSWVSAPGRVGAVAPSSEALSRLMTNGIVPTEGPILELGAGTGVFTRALLARGVRESDLTIVEAGSEFARALSTQFPQARVIRMDAAELARQPLFPEPAVAAVISGLPLLSMPSESVSDVIAGAFAHLRPGGAFYQFTYGPKCPVPRHILDRLGLVAVRVGSTFFNVPPASVYRITRRGE